MNCAQRKISDRKGSILATGLGVCLVLSILIFLPAFAETDAEFNVRNVVAFRATIAKHLQGDKKGKRTQRDIEMFASQLMMIKNGMSLYRDGALPPELVNKLKDLVARHLAFGEVAISSIGPKRDRDLAEIVHHHALHASRVLGLKKGTAQFEQAMLKYDVTTGHIAYQRAQDLGVNQVWLYE